MSAAENSPTPRRWVFWLANAAFLALVLFIVVLPRVHRSDQLAVTSTSGSSSLGQAIPPGRVAANFTLTDQDGKPFTLASQQGKIVLLFFGFTHCPNICPTTLANAALIYRKLTAAEQKQVQIAFVTVDPDRDDAAALKEYVPYFDASFIGLTGTPEQIAAVAKDYGVSYEKAVQSSQVAANNYTINHSVYVYLINPKGDLAVIYNSAVLHDTEAIVADLRRVLEGAAP